MRATARLFSQVSKAASPRAHTTAFIGLGRMGSEMAYNLFSRTLVESDGNSHFVVCDAVVDAARAFSDNLTAQFPGANIQVVETPAEAAALSSTIVTMLPSSPHVRQVYSESYGIIPALLSLSPDGQRSTLCIDSTTLDVQVAREIAAEVHKSGATMVDAPVSGGVAGAKAATLSFLVGGTEDAFQRTSPILAHMGKKIIHCGPSGAGLGAKICNNLILGVQQIVVAEAMLLGQKLGLDPAVLAGVINSSTGACWASSVNNPVPGALATSPPCTRDYEGGFATSLMLKDMGLATEIADAYSTPLPMGEAAENMYADVVTQVPELAKRDFSSVYRYLQLSAERKQVA
ncbi:3-hydroxyisobutyrate dehydrogenase [Cristinia sonorae]|uniref:3-hydroxyisobutyrate dehydrogenase n=1 Tax=Cristinia sonorae TaxID=1940300 RepID=A0A8K0XVI1_9AGAR|nr:3-hydroxyisobutyrate dehydrogenase [Cristinia sonorae]